MDEWIDLVDEAGEKTGETVLKSEAHRLGLWHRCFHCWICDPGSDEDGPFLLVQRRADVKDTWPGYLDVTAAGHLSAGEETVDGLREVEEELGLRVEPDRLVPLGTRRVELEIPAGMDREFHDVFLLFDDTPPGELRLQREEVGAVLRVRLGDAEALPETGSAPALEYGHHGETRGVRIRPKDFVPNDDDYFARAARAARRWLSGERVGVF